jgi:hypothetical protein
MLGIFKTGSREPGWLSTMILLIPASLARITGMSYQCPADHAYFYVLFLSVGFCTDFKK